MLALSGGLKDLAVRDPGDGSKELDLTGCFSGSRLVYAYQSKVFGVY